MRTTNHATTQGLHDDEQQQFDGSSLDRYSVLVINPGSTSTKIAIYQGREPLVELSLQHATEDLKRFASVVDQYEWRKDIILKTLKDNNIELDSLSAVIGRGGLLSPMESGVYEVNERMIEELRGCTPQHASNLGAMLASEIASMCNVKAYIADPIVVDERLERAKVTGIKEIRNRSIWHALNQKATARRYADEIGRRYEDLNLVVAHMGGGISIAAHRKGRVIDCNNALDGEGPIAPERAGTIPAGALIDLCYSGKYTHAEARALIVGKGGLVSLTGTSSTIEIPRRAAEGDPEAKLAFDAMIHGVVKHIGQMAAVLRGEVDAILITGGIAHSKQVTDSISDYCRFIAPIEIYPGENELQSLAMNALRVLSGQLDAKTY